MSVNRSRIITLSVAFLTIMGTSALAQDAKVTLGMKLFTDKKCPLCHMVAGKGNKNGPLDGVGSKLTPAEIKRWLLNSKEEAAKIKAERKPEMLDFSKLPPEEIDALVAYVSSLKK